MAVRNLGSGGGNKFQTEVQGLKELGATLRRMIPTSPGMSAELHEVVARAGKVTADTMRTSARAAGWPEVETATVKRRGWNRAQKITVPVAKAIFSFAGERAGKQFSALAGVGKRKSMVQWIAGKHPKSQNARVAPGNEVAMALATMYEFGTSNRPAKPAIRTAFNSARGLIVDTIKVGLFDVFAKFSK